MSTTAIPAPNPPATRPKNTWRAHPQRVWLRRALFQIHLWVGLALTLYAILIGLSGAALVFRPEIEHHLHPELIHITPVAPRTTLAATIRQVEHDRPGWTVSSLRDFSKPTQATALLMRRTGTALDANFRAVSVNPYTGEVLGDSMRFAGPLGWLQNLHFYLLAGRKGLLVSGWMTLGLIVLCLTGLVVWWPGVARWRSSLIVRPHVRWRRLNWDLHSAVGFWFSASLLLLSLTGLYFAFPKPTSTAVLWLTHSRPTPPQLAGQAQTPSHSTPAAGPKHPVSPQPSQPVKAGAATRQSAGQLGSAPVQRPANAPRDLPADSSMSQPAPLTADQAIARARQLLPVNAPPDYLSLPSRPNTPIYATGYYLGAAPYSQLVSISIDARTGALLSRTDTRQGSIGERLIQFTFALHFGTFAGEGPLGMAVKCIWVLAGLSPALLALTGLLMYWNRKLRPLLKRRGYLS